MCPRQNGCSRTWTKVGQEFWLGSAARCSLAMHSACFVTMGAFRSASIASIREQPILGTLIVRRWWPIHASDVVFHNQIKMDA